MIFQLYEKEYGFKITNAEDLFKAQGNLLKYIMKMGKKLKKGMQQIRSALKSGRLFKDFKLVFKDAA